MHLRYWWYQYLKILLNRYCVKFAEEYLENASSDMFVGIKKKVYGLTTTLLERMIGTINQRINGITLGIFM